MDQNLSEEDMMFVARGDIACGNLSSVTKPSKAFQSLIKRLNSLESLRVLHESVCEKLGIMGPESEYFGLQYTGRKGESLWLNTRNQIDRCLQAPCRLKLKVKFFVQPHLLLQESTRHEFYLQIVEDFLQGALTVTQRHQLIKMASLIAQVETPYHDSQNINLESYTTFIPEPILRDLHNSDDTSELRSLVQDVCSEHSKLGDITSSLASYKVLQEATL
ncbi:unnamed protein product [Owenia fusiformis]|uniref:Uncharacterized protein n=1 Tax=Owenia fusiformis TaxID=6347 RepID=A0A8J1XT56_OWEFU|nr:unnamed protein product [Owenia fusiformis]